MTLSKDDMFALVHDMSSAGLAATIIHAPDDSSEDSKPSEQTKSLQRSKSSEHCNFNNRSRVRGNEEPHISHNSDDRRQRYSSMSAEVCPTRDSVLQKKLAKKIEVRHVNEIKNLNGKFSSSGPFSCPKLRERLKQHQLIHHSNYGKINYACNTQSVRDQGINVTPTISRMRLPKFVMPSNEDRPIQTDITMKDFSPIRLFKRKAESTIDLLNEIPLRKTETKEILPKRKIYKEHLQNEVLNWLHNIPVFYSLNFTSNDVKDNVVNDLVETINALAVEAHEESYEMKTKTVIEDCLNRLPMWLHGSKQDQILFKGILREKLWRKIQVLNENFLGVIYKEAVGYEDFDYKSETHDLYEKEVFAWSLKLLLDPKERISRRQVVDLTMKRLSPLLKIPLHTANHKLILKGEIIEILNDLPLSLTSQRYRTVHLNRLSEELANRLLSVQIKQESGPKNAAISVLHQVAGQVTELSIPQSHYDLKGLILNKIDQCLDRVPVCHRNDLKIEICSSFLDSESCLRIGSEMNIKEEICQFLRDTGKISEDKTEIVANMIIKQVKYAIRDVKQSATTSFNSIMPQLSKAISVYTYESENPPTTSTPKKARRKEIPKLSPEETSYIEKVAALIKVWIKTLPKQYNEDPGFQETMIYDLAGEIMDYHKLAQLAPETIEDKEKYQKYLVYKWFYKFSIFDDDKIRNDATPKVLDFLGKLKNIPVPKLTASQHGTRQEMGHIKHMETEHGWADDYVAEGIDVLEDQISIWMNEQPSEIYMNKDKGKRNKMVHDLALNLQDHLRNNSPDSEIDENINQWLKQVVKPSEKEHIGLLSQDLKDKIIDLPQDETLGARNEERKRVLLAKMAAKRQEKERIPSTQHAQDVSNIGNVEGDPDETIREFIGKYIEYYYDIDDHMATGAFAHLLKTELRKLTPLSRKEVYDNFEQLKSHEKFKPENLHRELEYIKIISDWLKSIPIEASYNTPGNKRRIEFINDLARNIQEIEEQRIENPDAMEYNYLIASTILQSMNTYELPIIREHRDNTPLMAEQLLQKLIEIRPLDPYSSLPLTSGSESLSLSLDMSDIKEQNLSAFISDYIRVNGRDIANDEMKLEAWTTRLMKEVKKMIHEGADPKTLTKAQVYDKFAGVAIPTEKSVDRFCLEMSYVKEITDWMKNLPLLPIENEEEIISMISELAENMCDTEAQREENPNDNSAGKKLEEYIATWISRLPLDKSKEINVPILTQQLMNRMKKGSLRDSKEPLEKQSQTNNDCRKKWKSVNNEDSKRSLFKRRSISNILLYSLSNKTCKSKTPAEIIIEAIENWSNKLPIKLDDKEVVKSMKEGIARQLYQKIGELNVDPTIFNDELLYREILGDEIDTQLENVPQNPELQDNRENLKEGLISTIIETNKIIKEKSAGDSYRHKLETTMDASIPNPVQSIQAFDPRFEIYKNHLADMFILDNFDHANEFVKAKYEKRIRHEIDKHFESAQNKNALPLTKDQIFNEIYSKLFKVPMPHEHSVIDEVEQVKTRCEIDAWYEDLPIQQTDNINELLETDKILSILAKRIHEIEKNGCKVDEHIDKEIRKWLEKLPLIPEQQGIDEHVKKLKALLKSTAKARSYVPPDLRTSKGKSKLVNKSKNKKRSKDPNISQISGPSGELQSKATNAKPCLLVTPMTHKKPGDIISEIVEEWCNQLPLTSTEENNQAIRDNISTRLIIQLCELNRDSEIFNDDVLYDELLDEELENVMSNLPVYCGFPKSKPARKYQFKEQIKSVKPLIQEVKARHEYKEELNNTVTKILKEPHDTSADKLSLFNQLKEEIVENFLQYYYHINDEEGRLIYKNQIHDVIVRFCIEIRDKGPAPCGEQVDPLIRRNQLLCELEKIPVPQLVLKEEVAEIKMKNEVEQFFREQSIPEGDTENTMKKLLAKRLCDIEKSGYNLPNEEKMKSEISRCLKKLNKDVNPEKIDDFVTRLKFNEAERKTPAITKSQASHLNQDCCLKQDCCSNQDGSSLSPRMYENGGSRKNFAPPGIGSQDTSRTPQQVCPYDPSQTENSENWISIPETERKFDQVVPGPQARVWSPAPQPIDQTLDQSVTGYENFEAGNLLSSSLNQSATGYESFEAGNLLSSSVAPQRAQNPRHRNCFSERPPVSPISSLGQQSRSLSKKQYQQEHCGSREATSGPMSSRPNFGQVATPRQVEQTLSQDYPGNTTSDSLFQAPVFEPAPIKLQSLPPLAIGPRPLPCSTAPMQGRSGPGNALAPSPGGPGVDDKRSRGFVRTLSSDEDVCICKRCARMNRNRIPLCMIGLDQYFNDCLGMPICMPVPECFFY